MSTPKGDLTQIQVSFLYAFHKYKKTFRLGVDFLSYLCQYIVRKAKQDTIYCVSKNGI